MSDLGHLATGVRLKGFQEWLELVLQRSIRVEGALEAEIQRVARRQVIEVERLHCTTTSTPCASARAVSSARSKTRWPGMSLMGPSAEHKLSGQIRTPRRAPSPERR